MTQSLIEPATFRFAAQCLNQLLCLFFETEHKFSDMLIFQSWSIPLAWPDRDSLVGIVAKLRAAKPKDHGSIPSMNKTFRSSP
jgi:hypothetical protein